MCIRHQLETRTQTEKTNFGTIAKKSIDYSSHKETATAVVPIVEPIRILPNDKSFHHLYFSKFIERVLPMFPMFSPTVYRVEEYTSALCMIDTSTWSVLQQLTPNVAGQKKLSEIMDCLEYSVLCAHGKYYCSIHC